MKQLMILIALAIGVSFISKSNEYVEIPSTSIRMRVIAESDSEKDQNTKIIVKSFLEEKLYEIIESSSEDEVDSIIEDKKTEIDEYVKEKIDENNLNTTFTSSYGLNYFPEKEFKGIKYNAGNYKSFVLTLGDGDGENWWCVLYPPLCLVDETLDDYEYHSLIKDTIEKYN